MGEDFQQKISRISLVKRVYDSRAIGMKDAADPEELKENKGSGFGLMNCKGIIERNIRKRMNCSGYAYSI